MIEEGNYQETRMPVKEMSASDLQRLITLTRKALPRTADGRHDLMVLALSNIPETKQGAILEEIDYQGAPEAVARASVMRLRDVGCPIRGLEALGFLIRAIAVRTVDVEDITWLEGLFHRYRLDDTASGPVLNESAWEGTLPQDRYEILIGEATFQPVFYLEEAFNASKAVVKITGPLGSGSGFLIEEGLIATCHHVVAKVGHLLDSLVTFNYQLGSNGKPLDRTVIVPDSGGPFATSPFEELDVTFFSIPVDQIPAGVKPLQFAVDRAHQGDAVSIIQHPGGQRKMISLRNNLVEFADDRVLQYTTSTLPGSSGSPVFNESMEVVGIHNKGSLKLVEPVSKQTFARNEASAARSILTWLRDHHGDIYTRVSPYKTATEGS